MSNTSTCKHLNANLNGFWESDQLNMINHISTSANVLENCTK